MFITEDIISAKFDVSQFCQILSVAIIASILGEVIGAKEPKKTGAYQARFKKVQDSINYKLLPNLRAIKAYSAVPDFIRQEPVASIEDLNVMAPDSIVQNKPIKYLRQGKPTRENVSGGSWGSDQKNKREEMYKKYDKKSKFMIDKF